MRIALVVGGFLALTSSLAESQKKSWNQISSPTSKFLHHVTFVDTLYGWAVGDSGAIIRTTDGGDNWTVLNPDVSSDIINVFFLNRTRGWALTWRIGIPPFGTDILETSDGGETWSLYPYPDGEWFLTTIFFLDSLTGWVGGHGISLAGTSDGGQTWRRADVTGGCLGFPPFHFVFYGNDFGIAAGGAIDFSGLVMRTTNGGSDWSAVCVSPEPIQKMVMFDSLNIIGVGGDFEFGSSVIRTRDGGVTWEYDFLEYFGVAFAVAFRNPAEGWAPMGFERKWLHTVDSGGTWQQFPTAQDIAIMDVVFTGPNRGVAVGYGGAILRYVDSSTVDVIQHSSTPGSTKLHQNYPNPFNPTTEISYTISRTATVKLHLYDTLGRLLRTLVDDVRVPGEYKEKVALHDLSSGVYLYRLEVLEEGGAGSLFRDTKKMVLIK